METWKCWDMYIETWNYGEMETWRHGTGTRKLRWFPLIRLLFAHHVNGLLLFVHLLTQKQTEVIPFANGLKWLNGLNGLVCLCVCPSTVRNIIVSVCLNCIFIPVLNDMFHVSDNFVNIFFTVCFSPWYMYYVWLSSWHTVCIASAYLISVW